MRECDLIMKGGITSGVVYPFAITELAKTYRLRGVGGSSAGAIAAVLAAAAEYRRQMSPDKQDVDGFKEIERIAEELANDMTSLLQPTEEFDALFSLLLEIAKDNDAEASPRWLRALRPAVNLLKKPLLVGGLLAAMGIAAAWLVGSNGLFAAVLVAGIALSAWLSFRKMAGLLLEELPRHDYGMLSGKTQIRKGPKLQPALTDWLADKIDIVAGNLGPEDEPMRPLTIGDLEAAGINLAAMTTDLTSQRPYQLPLRSAHHFFSKREAEVLFPGRVVAYLIGDSTPEDGHAEEGPDDLYPMPIGADFPVLLVARLSLSFPVLIQAVPLWRKDWQLKTAEEEHGVWRRCLFSDGGISSNMPVHLFDTWLPQRPTFAIALGDWDERRHGDERVHLSERPRQSTSLPTPQIGSMGAFLYAILNTAKDWQDTLQTRLPGFAERIVEVRLDARSEGGMNLTMRPEVVNRLSELGREAGRKLGEEFDFDENRWRRAVSILPEIEASLVGFSNAYEASPTGGEDVTYKSLLTSYEPRRYKSTQRWREAAMVPFAESLAALGKSARSAPDEQTLRGGKTPKQDANLRLIADADRVSTRNRGEDGT